MTAADVEAVSALADGLPTAPHWKAEAYRNALDAGRVALVAEGADGRVVGFVLAGGVLPEAEIESVAVAAAWQRRGAARRLMEALIRELVARGASEVLLEVRASNAAALGFYRAAGFEESGRRRGYYADPVEDAVLMRRAIL